MQIIKYTFDVHVVAMVSHIPAKSRMAVNYVSYLITIREWKHSGGFQGGI